MRVAIVLALSVSLAGCGGGSSAPKVPGAPPEAKVQTRDLGGGWSVAWTSVRAEAWAAVLRDGKAVGGVSVEPLGPNPGETVGSLPQVAAELKADEAIVDYSLFVDDGPLEVRGGGLKPQRISIYGAPVSSLPSGRHVAVAVARAGDSAGAAAWVFIVR